MVKIIKKLTRKQVESYTLWNHNTTLCWIGNTIWVQSDRVKSQRIQFKTKTGICMKEYNVNVKFKLNLDWRQIFFLVSICFCSCLITYHILVTFNQQLTSQRTNFPSDSWGEPRNININQIQRQIKEGKLSNKNADFYEALEKLWSTSKKSSYFFIITFPCCVVFSIQFN